LKQFIITNDHDVRIHYSFRTWVYNIEDVKAMYLEKENRRKKLWHVAGLYALAVASLFPALRHTSLYIIPFLIACYIVYTTPAQPYNYYLVVDTTVTRHRIKINRKHRLGVLKDITAFLNYHFMYRTFNTMTA